MKTLTAAEIAARHNAGVANKSNADPTGNVKSYVDRLVALIEEKKTFDEDIKELKKEAKDHGLNPKALAVAAKRKMETEEQRLKRVADEEVVDGYLAALQLLD